MKNTLNSQKAPLNLTCQKIYSDDTNFKILLLSLLWSQFSEGETQSCPLDNFNISEPTKSIQWTLIGGGIFAL